MRPVANYFQLSEEEGWELLHLTAGFVLHFEMLMAYSITYNRTLTNLFRSMGSLRQVLSVNFNLLCHNFRNSSEEFHFGRNNVA